MIIFYKTFIDRYVFSVPAVSILSAQNIHLTRNTATKGRGKKLTNFQLLRVNQLIMSDQSSVVVVSFFSCFFWICAIKIRREPV